MTTFVLVHGAFHGAWCWDRLVPELERRGHDSLAMDLPVDDASATFTTYADAVLRAMEAARAPGDAVLVGHSLGGMVLPLVASARPVARMVFLCAVIPNLQGQPWEDAPPMGLDDYGTVRDDDGTLWFDSAAAATAIFYPDCTPEDAAWACARLRPLRNGSLWDRPYPLTGWPAVPASAISAVDDQAIFASYQKACCEARLGITPVEIGGAHSPFLSRPPELAGLLDALARP